MDSGVVVSPPHVAGPLRLAPFRALMLAPNRVGDPSSGRAFARPYKDVAGRLARWQRQGRLIHDEEPAVHLHEYTAGGITVRGLVGLLDVSRRAHRVADRAVLPHEGIYPAQADDLAARMEEMQLNPAPILLVHRAPETLRTWVREVALGEPTHSFRDRALQQHRLWAVRDAAALAHLNDLLAPQQALIADGHHRYAAYLRLHQRHPDGPTSTGLAMLVDHGDTPLFLGAIHRAFAGTSFDDVLSAVDAVGLEAEELAEPDAIAALAPRRLVVTDGRRWAAVPVPEDGRAVVEVLHERLVPAFRHGPRRTSYHHAVDDALARARPGADVAVLLPAPDVTQVIDAARRDRLLPEKATSFQPKPSLGVLIRSLRDG